MRHLAIVTLTAIALAPRTGAAQSSEPTPAPGEPEHDQILVAPHLLGDVDDPDVRSTWRPLAYSTEQPELGRRPSLVDPQPSAHASQPHASYYTPEQIELARDARIVYGVGVGAGIAGIAPFLVAFLYESSPPGLSCAFVASALWTTEPVQMLVADLLVDRALGYGPSAANIAGWVMLALTVALPTIGGALFLADVQNDDPAIGLAITGAVLFLPMQIFTDVLGSRAVHRAGHIVRREEVF